MPRDKWSYAGRNAVCRSCSTPIPSGTEMFVKTAGVYYCQACGNLYETTERTVGELEEAVNKDLGTMPDEAKDSTFAQAALYMARQLDDGDIPPREVPTYTKEIRMNMMELWMRFPPQGEEDETDQAQARLERRRRESGGI
jgi:hypothetical protein